MHADLGESQIPIGVGVLRNSKVKSFQQSLCGIISRHTFARVTASLPLISAVKLLCYGKSIFTATVVHVRIL